MKIVIYLLMLLIWNALNTEAKENFYTPNDVKCVSDDECYIKATDKLLSGELRVMDKKGKLYKLVYYKKGKRNGKNIEYYGDGKIRFIEMYSDGVLHGVSREFYENGRYKTELYFKNGKRNGRYREYYENGKLKEDKIYVDGVLDGRARMFYENGKMAIDIEYDNDELVNLYCLSKRGRRYNMRAQIKDFKEQGRAVCEKIAN